MLKKAAMFGLDARIALAILGSLSVISGAVLHSAIVESKATTIIVELKEVAKAYQQYYLDTRTELPRRSSDTSDWKYYSYSTSDLVNNNSSIAGWNGPYLPYEQDSGGELFLNHPVYGNVLMEFVNDEDWSATQWSSCNTAGDKCYLAVSIDGIGDARIAEIIDEKVDGGDGAGAGNFRWIPSNLNARFMLFINPMDNPKD